MDSRCLTENAVVEFVEGRLAPAAIADLERHLDECEVCRVLVARAAGPRTDTSTPAATFAAGQLVAQRYRIVRFIGQGGMGEVYEARDQTLDEPVALKTVHSTLSDMPAIRDRLKREVQLARRVTHANVCRVFDVGFATGDTDATIFLTMELLVGETLAERLRRAGPLTGAAALAVATQLAAGLAAAHAVGVIHRDFKSANVVLVGEPDQPRAIVTDFGLARARAAAPHAAEPVEPAGASGTPGYMAPEQARGEPATAASDVYALGFVLAELAAGRPSFDAAGGAATPPAFPADLARLSAVVRRCLAVAPAARYRSAGEVLAALTEWPRRRRSRVAAMVGVGGVVAALAAVFVVPSRGRQSTVAPRASRPGVAVLSLRPAAGVAELPWLAAALAESWRAELAAGEEIRVVPAAEVAGLERDVGPAPMATGHGPDTAILGRARRAGADRVLTGTYAAVGERGQLTLRVDLWDTRTAARVASSAAVGELSALPELIVHAGAPVREALGARALSEAERQIVAARLPAGSPARELYATGLAELDALDVRAAREMLERAVEAAPDHPLVRMALARADELMGHHTAALEQAVRATRGTAELPREDALELQGGFRKLTGQWTRVAEVYRSLSLLFPDEVDHQLELAAAESANRDSGEAARTLAELHLRRWPDGVDPRVDLLEATVEQRVGHVDKALAAARRAEVTAGEWRAWGFLADSLLAQANARAAGGGLVDATILAVLAESLFAATGDRHAAAGAVRAAGLYLGGGRGQEGAARRLLESALDEYRELGEAQAESDVLMDLASLALRGGEAERSTDLARQALALAEPLGDEGRTIGVMDRFAMMQADEGDLAAARAQLSAATSLLPRLGSTPAGLAMRFSDYAVECLTLCSLAAALDEAGDPAARDRWAEVFGLAAPLDKTLAAECYVRHARALADDGDAVAAESELRAVLDNDKLREALPDEGSAWALLALVVAGSANSRAAPALIEQASALETDKPDDGLRWRAQIDLAHARGMLARGESRRPAIEELDHIAIETARLGLAGIAVRARAAAVQLECQAGMAHPDAAPAISVARAQGALRLAGLTEAACANAAVK